MVPWTGFAVMRGEVERIEDELGRYNDKLDVEGEKEEETEYRLPQVDAESIQTYPEILKASVPQMMIEQCCLTHKQITFKGTAAPTPSSWLSSEEIKVVNSQFESSTKGCGENQQVFDDVDLRSQRVGECIEDVSGVLYEPYDQKQAAR